MTLRSTSSSAQAPTSSSLKLVDLFCGAGGLSEGFRREGYEVSAGADYDPDAIATYAANFRGAASICGDVRSPAIREELNSLAQGADVIIGGPPCQGFSQVRNHSRLIDDPRNSLYREFVSTVAAVRPSGFLMENVPGMAQVGVQEQVKADLSLDGEYLVHAELLDAADFGVPQTRKRLFFFGVRRDLGVEPPSLLGTGATAAVQLVRFVRSTDHGGPEYVVTARPDEVGEALALRLADADDATLVSVEQAIGDLKELEMGRRADEIALGELSTPTSAYQRLMRTGHSGLLQNVSVPRAQRDTLLRLQGIPPGGNHRDLTKDLTARYLTGDRWGPSNGTGQLGRSHYYAYRRLNPEIWAWTINTKADSAYHYSAARSLSVREFARLQSFPDHFAFLTDRRRGLLPGRASGGAAHSKYRQVGNAVPPLLAAAAAAAMREVLDAASLQSSVRKA